MAMIRAVSGLKLESEDIKMKKILSLFVVMVVVSMLAGCVSGEKTDEPTMAPATESPEALESSEILKEPETRILTDELGREVKMPENPERILALTSATMTAVYNLELPLVGKVDEYKITEEGQSLPSVGKSQSVNVESIYALEPDLIIASSRFHAALVEELEGTGATVYFFDPDTAGEIPVVEVTSYIGDILNMTDKGSAYVKEALASATDIAAQIHDKFDIKTGIMLQPGESVMAAQSATSYGSMLTLMDIDNIVPDNLPNAKKSSFVAYDIEQIVANNPDVIYLVAQTNDKEANKQMLQDFMKDEKWERLDAVKNKMVVILPFKANPNRAAPIDMLQLAADALLNKSK